MSTHILYITASAAFLIASLYVPGAGVPLGIIGLYYGAGIVAGKALHAFPVYWYYWFIIVDLCLGLYVGHTFKSAFGAAAALCCFFMAYVAMLILHSNDWLFHNYDRLMAAANAVFIVAIVAHYWA